MLWEFGKSARLGGHSVRRRYWQRVAAQVCVVFGCVSAVVPAQAEYGELYEAHIIDMSVSAALDSIGRDLGLEFSGDRTDRRRIVDLSLEGTPEDVVAQIMRHAAMDSFKFGGQIYYAPESERAVRLVPLEDISFEDAFAALDAAGLIFPDFEVTSVANGAAMVLSGPVRYLAISEGVVNAIELEPDVAEATVTIRRGGIIESDLQPAVVSDTSSETLN